MYEDDEHTSVGLVLSPASSAASTASAGVADAVPVRLSRGRYAIVPERIVGAIASCCTLSSTTLSEEDRRTWSKGLGDILKNPRAYTAAGPGGTGLPAPGGSDGP